MQEREHFNPYLDKNIVAEIFLYKPSTAGKIITEINKSLKAKGILTFPGRVTVDDLVNAYPTVNRTTVLKIYNDMKKGTSAN